MTYINRPYFWATFFPRIGFCNNLEKMGGAVFWATFSRTHLVTLFGWFINVGKSKWTFSIIPRINSVDDLLVRQYLREAQKFFESIWPNIPSILSFHSIKIFGNLAPSKQAWQDRLLSRILAIESFHFNQFYSFLIYTKIIFLSHYPKFSPKKSFKLGLYDTIGWCDPKFGRWTHTLLCKQALYLPTANIHEQYGCARGPFVTSPLVPKGEFHP
jgi:hypothetical protein